MSQNFWYKFSTHPLIIIIAFLGSILSIVSFFEAGHIIDMSLIKKIWNITYEYSVEREDSTEIQKNSTPLTNVQKNSTPLTNVQKNSTPLTNIQKNSTPSDKKKYSNAITIKPSLGFSKDAKIEELLREFLHQKGINDWYQASLIAEFERSGNACTTEVLISVNGVKKFYGDGIGLTLQSERPVPSKTVMEYRALEHCLIKLLKTKG